MAHRSQSSSIGDNPLDPNYLPPHYREEYRLAIDALIENDIQVTLGFSTCVFLWVYRMNSYLKYSKKMCTLVLWLWFNEFGCVSCHTRATLSSSRLQMWSISWRSRKLNLSSPQSTHPTRPPASQSWHTMREVRRLMAPQTPTGPCSPTWLPRDWIWDGRCHSTASWGPQRSPLWSTPLTQTCQASRSRPGDSSRMHVK